MFRWIIRGQSEYDIIEAVRANWPKRDAKKLIGEAMLRIHEAGQVESATLRGWCFEAYRDLYRRLASVGDYAGALSAVKEISKLPPPPKTGTVK